MTVSICPLLTIVFNCISLSPDNVVLWAQKPNVVPLEGLDAFFKAILYANVNVDLYFPQLQDVCSKYPYASNAPYAQQGTYGQSGRY